MPEVEEKNENKKIIKASPTKNFFISMLIRDLTLRDAIGDLVDNSVDGARTLYPESNYSGLEVKIEASKDKFVIEDNCGGISVNTAREYAFRFGRPDDVPPTPGSIGQFGIGMKRALFKLGTNFTIESIASTSRFSMEVDVNSWATDKDNWDFQFKSYHENLEEIPIDQRGTRIEVTNLRQDVIDQFSNSNFIKRLFSEIELENLYNIFKGLKISINGAKLKARNLELIKSNDIKTGYWHYYFGEEKKMTVEVYAGVAEPILEQGGWYIFCNDRLVVGPEQTEITGWTGGRTSDGGPKYHGQFNRFRGYVFFKAERASSLPWNTTKNNMDLDSPDFIFVRQQMIQMMKPVISFLNRMKEERENDNPSEERPLEKIMEQAIAIPLSAISKTEDTAATFTFPALPPVRRQKSDENKIVYLKPKAIVEKVKKALGVTNLKEVGERTFDYYYEMEVGD